MDTWKPDRLLKLLLGWTTLTFLLSWLPMIRALFDGPTYHWGFPLFGIPLSGSGTAGPFWILPIQTTLGLAILWLGWRGVRNPFHALLLAWHGIQFSNAVFSSIRFPENYRFRGDTMGIDVSLAWAGPTLLGGFLVLAVIWVVGDFGSTDERARPVWTTGNTYWLAGLLALLPVQFVLLRFGPPHGITDKIGVVLTIVQWLLVGAMLKPRED